MPDEEKYDWESCDHGHRSTRGRTQEKWSFRPCEYENVEYVLWEGLFGGASLDMPTDHVVFREHGFEPIPEARLSINGSIDFLCGSSDLDLTIDIDQQDCETAYLKELLRILKVARRVIKNRQAYLKQQKTVEEPNA